MANPIKPMAVADLTLDDQNPRLPESVQGTNQEFICDYLVKHGNLDELAQSFIENGYFSAEPLVADNRGRVLEGNRRLATLKILLGQDPEHTFRNLPANWKSKLPELKLVPVVQVDTREEADRFVAFRHIGGLKAWEPEAKARYIFRAIREINKLGVANPFQMLAGRVGSNSQSIRTAYLAMALLNYANSEYGIEVAAIQEDRFGVWLRALSSEGVRGYIGLSEAKTVAEIDEMVGKLPASGIKRVIEDLSPQNGVRPLIQDSRNLSNYGRILSNERARTVLSRYGYQAASRVVEVGAIADRIRVLADSCREIIETINQDDENPDRRPIDESNQLINHARSLKGTLEQRLSPDD